MNKKILMGLLISFIACEAMASINPLSPIVSKQKLEANTEDSPMTKLIKQRKTRKSFPLAKAALQRTKALENSKNELKKENVELTEKTMNQQIQLLYTKFISNARQAARNKLTELLVGDTEKNEELKSLQEGSIDDIRDFLDNTCDDVSDECLLNIFQTAALSANEYYQQKVNELTNHITSNTGLISKEICKEVLSLSECIVKNTPPAKSIDDINSEVIEQLIKKFETEKSVIDNFSATLKDLLGDEQNEFTEESSTPSLKEDPFHVTTDSNTAGIF